MRIQETLRGEQVTGPAGAEPLDTIRLEDRPIEGGEREAVFLKNFFF